MNVAFVGCGFFAAHYGDSLPNHPELRPVAAFDIVQSRAEAFSKRYNIPVVKSLQAVLDDPDIDIIVNLVTPSSRVEVSRAALLAGKHVYSDKPLSLKREGAKELIHFAAKQKLLLAVAPCNHLGGSMQTLARLVREDVVGTPQLVYVEIDDGPIHNLPYNTWLSKHDALWPAETEFRVGCVWEHAGYAVGYLSSVFGPAASVTSFSDVLIPNKMVKIPPKELGADFCVAIIRFRSGVIARLTIGTVARRNRSMTITGDKGILYIPEIWDDEVPIQFTLQRGVTEMPTSSLLATSHGAKVNGGGAVNGASKVNGTSKTNGTSHLNGTSASASTQEKGIQIHTLMDSPRQYPKAPPMDVCLGLADLASSLCEKRRPRMAADYAYHVYEILHALHESVATPGYREIKSDFEAIEPMPPLKTVASECTISW